MNRFIVDRLRTTLIGPVSLEVGAGECVGLSGPSGSGKTLLLRALADLDPHDGEVRLDGVRCREMMAPHWRREVALLAAESHWWAGEVGEHFNGCDRLALHQLGFADEALQWSVERLSSGERQRLALLRVLCNEPKVLLLDEPTANLDPESTQKVEELIAGYRKRIGAAVLWVSHSREQLGRVADRCLSINAGRLEQSAGTACN